MFDLIFSGLRPLWRPLEQLLRDRLKKQGAKLISKFREILTSTVDDLITALREGFHDTGIWRSLSRDKIVPNNGESHPFAVISFDSFPMNRLFASEAIITRLATHLRKNVNLDAIRSDLGISDAAWDKLIADYSAEFVRHGIPFALRRMMRQNIELSNKQILAIAGAEAYSVNGQAGHIDMVKLYFQPSRYSSDPPIRKARKIWDARLAEKYKYEKGQYNDGSKVP